jgi:TonB family protein
MRFSVRSVFALLPIAAACASTTDGAAADLTPSASPPPAAPYVCPGTEVMATQDGKTYVATFGRSTPWSGAVSISLYTATASYRVQFPISATKQVGASEYRSQPIAIANTSGEKLDGIEVDFGEADEAGECADHFHLPDDLTTDSDAKKALAELDPGQPPVLAVRVSGESDVPTCKTPYQSARVDGEPAKLNYPFAAQAIGATGYALIEVKLKATGAVALAKVVRSTGNDYLDAAALKAASQTRYSPDVFRCEPITSYYLFKADFEP